MFAMPLMDVAVQEVAALGLDSEEFRAFYEEALPRTKLLAATAERRSKLRAMPYREYLQTPDWQRRRQAALEQAGRRCQVSSSDRRLEVHRTYERRGSEAPEGLTVLCDRCHGLYHEQGRLARYGPRTQ